MNVEQPKAACTELPDCKLIKHRSDKFFGIEENKPITFFILMGGADSFPDIVPYGYTSKGLGWVHPIGTHFIGKRMGCTNISEPNSCYVCEQIKELDEKLTPLKQDADAAMRYNPDEGYKLVLQAQEFEKQIRGIIQGVPCQQKYAINVLVKGQETPVVYEALKCVAEPIYEIFETALTEDGINIFDPMQSTAFTILKVGQGLATEYRVTPSLRPVPIIAGERREERIKKALLAGTNFDEKYKLPTRTEQVTAWQAYAVEHLPPVNDRVGTVWFFKR